MKLKTYEWLGYGAVALVMLWAHYLIFVYAPTERVMGAVQRVFYFHVGSAIAAYVSIAVVFLGSLLYLAQKSLVMDLVAEAAAEIGFLFCTLVLVSGMIWGHAAWGTWFNWEPRLVTFLLLWLLFMSYVLLRVFGDPLAIKSHAAILGIAGTIMVPIMVFSIKILPQMKQLHPEVIDKQGLDPRMGFTLAISILACVLLQALLLYVRVRIGFLEKSSKE
ncbi:MAG: cytochrome c biogenesis protein CcsA [Bdellovibrionales bacterium]|nr:cytochrome c biogenesis protein CcsA [Bdellovibrionales bacterium]